MSNHKRGKPKSARAGCLMCKPQKHQAFSKRDRLRPNQLRQLQKSASDY